MAERGKQGEQPLEAWERAVTRLTEAKAELEKLKGVSDELMLLGEEVHDLLTRLKQQNIPASAAS